MTVGVPVRVHDVSGDDLGIAHVPSPLAAGDLFELGGDGLIRSPVRGQLIDTPREAPSPRT